MKKVKGPSEQLSVEPFKLFSQLTAPYMQLDKQKLVAVVFPENHTFWTIKKSYLENGNGISEHSRS